MKLNKRRSKRNQTNQVVLQRKETEQLHPTIYKFKMTPLRIETKHGVLLTQKWQVGMRRQREHVEMLCTGPDQGTGCVSEPTHSGQTGNLLPALPPRVAARASTATPVTVPAVILMLTRRRLIPAATSGTPLTAVIATTTVPTGLLRGRRGSVPL